MKKTDIKADVHYAVATVNESDEVGYPFLKRCVVTNFAAQKRTYSGSRDVRGHMTSGYLQVQVLDEETGEPKAHWQTGDPIFAIVRPQAFKAGWEDHLDMAQRRKEREVAIAEAKARRQSKTDLVVETLRERGYSYSDVRSMNGRVDVSPDVLMDILGLSEL